MGFINDIKIQRKLYSIADVFVATSLQEGFPYIHQQIIVLMA